MPTAPLSTPKAPAPQFVQLVRPVRSWYLPAAQLVHAAALLAAA
jgi:hypothetical protein